MERAFLVQVSTERKLPDTVENILFFTFQKLTKETLNKILSMNSIGR